MVGWGRVANVGVLGGVALALMLRPPEKPRAPAPAPFQAAPTVAHVRPPAAHVRSYADVEHDPRFARVDIQDQWASEVASELDHRTTPIVTLPNRSFTVVGRCAVEMTARGATSESFARSTFVARNGASFSIDTDELNGSLRSVRQTPPKKLSPEISQVDAVRAAAKFVALDMDLWGIDADDLRGSTATVQRMFGPTDTSPDRFTFQIDGQRPEPSYSTFRSMDRKWRLNLTMRVDGQILDIGGRIDEVRGASICANPVLTKAEAANHVVGQDLVHGSNSGWHTYGQARAEDIKSTELTIYRTNRLDPIRTLVQLAYEINVMVGSDTYTFMVDADTGRILTHFTRTTYD